MRKLLYLDSSFTLEQIQDQGLNKVLRVRHLDGYWEKVWSVHPIDMRLSRDGGDSAFGLPVFKKLEDDHVFIRGQYGLFTWLKFIPPVNFVLGQIALIWTLIRLVKRENITAIRVGDPLLCGPIGLIVARATGRKVMIRVPANNDAIRASTGEVLMPRLLRYRAVEKFIEKMVFTRVDQIIGMGQFYLDFAISSGADPSRCHIVRNGNLIEPCHFEPPEERSAIQDAAISDKLSKRPFLIYIGRLQKLKFADHCIDILRLVVEHGHDVSLVMVGEGPLADELMNMARQQGVEDRLILLGARDQQFLADIIPMSAVVLSTLTGRSLAEAAFGGAPIVAYDYDWQGEVVVDGVSGLLVPYPDKQAMANAAIRLLDDPKLAKKLGKGARDHVFDILDPEKQTRREIDIYRLMETPAV